MNNRDERHSSTFLPSPTFSGRYLMTRRLCFRLIVATIPLSAFARPKLGDAEWMRRFRDFVRIFNGFVDSLNEGRFDLSKWRRMRAVWTELDVD